MTSSWFICAMLAASVAWAAPTEIRDCADCPELVVVPAGQFHMGSAHSEQGRLADEGPLHTVTFAKPFAIGKYEVTFDEWDACVAAKACDAVSDEGWGRGRRPVIYVNFEMAKGYANWLTKKTGKQYRVPSEAEWEYAARGGSSTRWFWGEDSKRACEFGNVGDESVKQEHPDWPRHDCNDGYAKTAPVGSFKPNGYGVHDTVGNVWEWVEDCSNPTYQGAPADGRAWLSGDCGKRLVRGGGWYNKPDAVRSAQRYAGDDPTRRNNTLGFRVVRSEPQELATANYERRVLDIPMRDGVKLRTVIVVPKGAKNAPILLTRTPYNAESMTLQEESNDMRALLDGFDHAVDVIVDGGYIRVVQDIRGKHGSGGDFVMTRPLAGTPFNRTSIDESTDAYDSIAWLAKHVPESNGKVGIIGTSYNGFTALMALVNPHPALKVAVPMDPMVDGWRGDDWFHNGAFRQYGIAAIHGSEARDNSAEFPWESPDLYDSFLRAGSVGELARRNGTDKVPFWRNIVEHPAYDEFWQSQAMDKILASRPLKVPTMLVGSLWDQEDIYGATAVYKAIEPRDQTGKQVYLSLGPWHHVQAIMDGSALGNIRWGQDTSKWWRENVLTPFLAHHLKGAPMDVAPVTVFQSGSNQWQRLDRWPLAAANAKLYLKPNGELGFDAPAGPIQTADYVSDPARPVTFVPRPMRTDDDQQWETWLTSDQRNIAARPDVLTFTTKVLDQAVSIAGEPIVKLMASTSGTDSDWVVKLIDVYPDDVADDSTLSGYQLPVAMDIFRGRYRKSLAQAEPIAANVPLLYEFALPDANHVFRPGHRIMVQVQSSWFPLYDRNPQSFVANIFLARPGDYVQATQKVVVAGPDASHIELPIRP